MTDTTAQSLAPTRYSPFARIAADRHSFETLVAWCVLGPVLAMWPFVSALPVFGLIAPVSLGQAILDLVLLSTGFWPLLSLWIVARLAWAGGLKNPIRYDHTLALKVGAYALVWQLAAIAALAWR